MSAVRIARSVTVVALDCILQSPWISCSCVARNGLFPTLNTTLGFFGSSVDHECSSRWGRQLAIQSWLRASKGQHERNARTDDKGPRLFT